MLDSLFCDLRTSGRIHSLTYKLKDVTSIPAGRQREIAKGAELGERTLYLYRKGGNAKKENAEKLAAYLGVELSELFEPVADNKELSVSTVSRVKNCISSILQAAVKKEILRRNPCLNTIKLERPRPAASFLDEQQAMTLLSALSQQDDLQFRAMITTLIYTGARGGEILGLLWENVDLEKGVIYICHTLAYIRGAAANNKHVLQDTKTTRSERYIVIPASLTALLKEHKARQDERRAALGKDWIDRRTVFTTPTGDYFYIGYLNVKFKQLAQKIGLPDGLHLHSLRHTNASLLINSDIPAKVISEQLGHASTQITQDIYSHIFASSKVKAMQALELKLGGAVDN